MRTLEEAWTWYQGAKSQIGLVRRPASHHWDDLPWEGKLNRDDRFQGLERRKLETDAKSTLDQLKDLAVLVPFSVFESQVRELLAVELRREVEKKSVTHPILVRAVDDLIDQVEEGSFFRVLGPFKTLDPDLVEKVNQVRRYRNWVAHGRRGDKPPSVDPKTAYERLSRFWDLINPRPSPPKAAGSP
jgi:hypothetical protein